MSKVVLILAATTVGLGALSVHLVKQMRDGQATIAELQAKVAELEKQYLAAIQSQPVFNVVPTEPSIAPVPTVAATATTPAKPAPSTGAQQSWKPLPPINASHEERMNMFRQARERQRELMKDPEYREAMRVQSRSNYSRIYPGLGEELGLTGQQTDEFYEMLSEQQMRATEASSALWSEVDAEDPEQRRKVNQQMEELQQRNRDELVARFGAGTSQLWQDYQSTLGARHEIERMRYTLASQGVPLSETSNKAMIAALAEAQKSQAQSTGQANIMTSLSALRSSGGNAMSPSREMLSMSPTEMAERQIENARKRNQATLDALGPFLSFEQRSAIEKEQEAQIKLQEANMRLMRGQSDSNGVGATAVQSVIVPAQ